MGENVPLRRDDEGVGKRPLSVGAPSFQRRLSGFDVRAMTEARHRESNPVENHDLAWGVQDKEPVVNFLPTEPQTYSDPDDKAVFFGEEKKPDADGFVDLASSAVSKGVFGAGPSTASHSNSAPRHTLKDFPPAQEPGDVNGS